MIWMRSGRKFSTKPIRAMPGRWMSLPVISRADDQMRLVDVVREPLQPLQTPGREFAHRRVELAVAGGGADVHRSSPPSRHPAAETRGQDAELFAVLRHGAAGDLEAALVEQL